MSAIFSLFVVLAAGLIWLTRRGSARIRFLAHHDVLTGLANRMLLDDIAERAVAAGRPFAVLCLDLDRFKSVNDTLGHHAGDLLIKQAAGRLTRCLAEGDTAARVGGDEFVVLLEEEPAFPGERAAACARRLIDALTAPYDLDGRRATIGVSVGIALYQRDGGTVDDLLKNADLALFHAKAHGRGDFVFYKSEMGRAQRERRALEQDLAAAIAAEEITLAFQPLFAKNDQDVVAFEALARWQHPTLGAIPPNVFIPLAEESGLIIPLGKWVLETACRTAVSWRRPCRIAVNVSARQFRTGDLPDIVGDILTRTGLPAGRLELEVTESLLIDDTAQALDALLALRALGCRIVLDDFGTGYSCLAYLQRFPFDMIKIDKSFTDHITTDSGTQAIVSAIVALSHRLQLKVTAEGVETAAQLQHLRLESCDQIQGYLLGRPMAADRIPDFLADPQRKLAA